MLIIENSCCFRRREIVIFMKSIKIEQRLCIILTFLIMLAFAPSFKVYADNPTNPEDIYTYEENTDGTLTITGLSNAITEAIVNPVIPSELDGKDVTVIGENAFYLCDLFTGNLTISEGIKEIRNSSFYGCNGLTGSLLIPNSVTHIGDYAFADLTNIDETITLPSSLEQIGSESFHESYNFKTLVNNSGIYITGAQFTSWAFFGLQSDSGLIIGYYDPIPKGIFTKLKDYVPVSYIILENKYATTSIGETLTLNVKEIAPIYATNKSLHWESSDTSIATVDQNGIVTGISEGYAEITVNANFGYASGHGDARCRVRVNDPQKPSEAIILVSSVSLDKTEATIEVGQTLQLTETISPQNATNKAVEWRSYEKSIATVDQSGLVTGVSPGTVKIRVDADNSTYGGYSPVYEYCRVTVVEAKQDDNPEQPDETNNPSDNKPADETSTNKPGDNTPTNTDSQADISSDTKTDTPTETKTDTPTNQTESKTDTPTNPTESADPDKSADSTKTEDKSEPTTKAVSSVTLNKKSATLLTGKTITLKASIKPSDATDKTLTWSSSNKKIATVNKKGVVKGLKKGTVTITATTGNGKKATCKITVNNPIKVKSIKFAKKSYSIKKGKKLTLKLTFKPKNATNKEVTYKTSNKKIATVDKNGKVKGLKRGTVTITATTKDGKKTATCTVTVK